jgi:hypothetical protein
MHGACAASDSGFAVMQPLDCGLLRLEMSAAGVSASQTARQSGDDRIYFLRSRRLNTMLGWLANSIQCRAWPSAARSELI